jgi:hypothetical protein
LVKEKPLKMSEFLKNKYFFNEKSGKISYVYILIPEKTSFIKENQLVLPEFLKTKYFVKKKSLKISNF